MMELEKRLHDDLKSACGGCLIKGNLPDFLFLFSFSKGVSNLIYLYIYGKSQEIPFDQLIQSQYPYQFKIMNLDEPQFHLLDYHFMKEFHQHLHILYWPEDVSQRGLNFLDFLEQSVCFTIS